MSRRAATAVEQAAFDLANRLMDAALTQCEERNLHAVFVLVAEANRIRSIPRKLRNILGEPS